MDNLNTKGIADLEHRRILSIFLIIELFNL